MGAVRAAAWAGATAAAVSVAWLGVHRVLGDSSYEQPRMLVAAGATDSPAAPPLPTAVGSAGRSASASPSASATPTPSATAHPGATTRPSGGTGPGSGGGGSGSGGSGISSYTRPGGRIVVDMGASSASLVSATPDAGWSMHTWTGDDWLRVDFEQGSADSIFYVTWNGHPPFVQTWGP